MGERAAVGEGEGVVIACRVVSGIVGDMAATGRGDRRRRGRSGQCTRGGKQRVDQRASVRSLGIRQADRKAQQRRGGSSRDMNSCEGTPGPCRLVDTVCVKAESSELGSIVGPARPFAAMSLQLPTGSSL